MHEETCRVVIAASHTAGCITIGNILFQLLESGFAVSTEKVGSKFRINAVKGKDLLIAESESLTEAFEKILEQWDGVE